MHKVFIEDTVGYEEQDNGISSTIKALPEDKQHKSNAEIEKKELVLRAGLDALHKAVGKSHANGGVPVRLNEGDFVYSADPKMNITKGEAKLFELKMPSSKKKRNWTPAKMVEKNMEVADYNRLISVLNDKHADEIAKTSASMMLQKYVNTLGSIAYLQEAKKGEQAPAFAQGVAPVYDTALKNEMDAQPQYMRKGGTFQKGGDWREIGYYGPTPIPRIINARGASDLFPEPEWAYPTSTGGYSGEPFIPNPAYRNTLQPSPFQSNSNNLLPRVPYYAQNDRRPRVNPASATLPANLQMNPLLPGYLQPINTAPAAASGEPRFSVRPDYLPGGAGNPITGRDNTGRIPAGQGVPGTGAGNPRGMKNGIWSGDQFPSVDPKTGKMSADWNAMTGYKDIYDYAKAVGYTGNINPKNFAQSAKDIQNYVVTNFPDLVNEFHAPAPRGFGQPNAGQPVDQKLGVRWANIANRIGAERDMPYSRQKIGINDPGTITGGNPRDLIKQQPQAAAPVVAGRTAAAPNPQQAGNTVLPYNPSIPLSPLQSLNVMYSGAQALTVPKFYPMRPQVDSPLVELEKLNPAAQINQAQTSAYQAYKANSIQNPVVAAAQNAGIYGRNLEAINQIQGQYDNQNVQIANQQNLANNQIQRQDQQQNIAFNQRYYDQTQMTEQNYLDERRAATNQTVGLFNKYRSQNDALAASLQGQRMYTKPVLDRNGKPRLDPNGNPIMQAAPVFDVDNTGWTPQIYHTGAGGLDNVPTQPNSGDLYEQTLQAGLRNGLTNREAHIAAVRMASSKPALQYSQAQYRKGGSVKRMRKSK